MSNSTISISVPDVLKVEVEKEIEAGGYGNKSEFFREAVRELLKKRQREKLEVLLLEGLDSGEPTPMTDETLDNIKARGLKRIQKMKQKAKK